MPAPVMTTDDYFRTPESVLPQELAYGTFRVAEAPTARHQTAVFSFGLALAPFVREHRLGRIYLSPVDVVLDPVRHLVVQPDLLYVSRGRIGFVKERIWGPPDMVLEVLSPNPRIGQLEERLSWFAEYGVRECWLLHQDRRRLEVVAFASGRRRVSRAFLRDAPIQSDVLPGWNLTLDEVLAVGEDEE